MSSRCCSLAHLFEAVRLIVAGCVVGVVTDLVLPGGVLGRTDEVLFHVESLVEVRLQTAEEAAAWLGRGEAILVDIRSAATRDLAPFSSAVSFPTEEQGSQVLQSEVLSAVANRDTLIAFDPGQEEEARRTAQMLVLEFSARTASTVEGGAPALRRVLERAMIEPTGSAP